MPKISSGGVPSYAGVSGQVTNAVGEQFDLSDPEVDGVVSLDGPDQVTPSTGTDADLAPEQDEDGQPVDEPKDADEDEKDGDLWDPAKPKPVGNQTPAFLPEKKTSKKK